MDHILIIDDDEELCDLVSEYLEKEGFAVRSVYDGAAGVEETKSGEYDLVVLDVMLPVKNGFAVLEEIRGNSGVPVVMLTARGEDRDRISGLEAGADDYLPKPFNPRELLARIRAILRRASAVALSSDPKAKLVADDLELTVSARKVTLGQKNVALTSVEFDVLAELLRNAGSVVPKTELSRNVMDRELSPFDRSLDMHISNLRKKLGSHPSGEPRIKTVRSVGYIYTLE